MINKILFITLSNIGDVILTLPALDFLRINFPESEITVIVGPRPKEIFENNPEIKKLIIYDKHAGLRQKVNLLRLLKKEKFDMVVDLRNGLFGAFLPARYKTSFLSIMPRHIEHMKDRHLYKLKTQNSKLKAKEPAVKAFHINPEDEKYINDILKENGISDEDKIVVVSAGARSHIKRWPKEKFVDLIPLITNEFNVKIILVGDKDDSQINKYIAEHSEYPVIDLSEETTVTQLASLLKRAGLLVTNDSAVMHLASYMNIPVVAIFGPTDELKYRPWSEIYSVVKKEIFCRPCRKAQCKYGNLDCTRLIKVEDVLRAVRDILDTRSPSHQVPPKADPPTAGTRPNNNFRRILIVRTDRIGDVLLSTPVIKALRDNYPNAYIAMMVSPYTKDIVEGNPYLDEVVIYDKEGKHKSWWRSIKFSQSLKKKRFDLALILHPANRVHLVTFFAAIPRRIGYNRKLGFLLTDRIKHTKQLGQMHELEYNLELLKVLGIEHQDKNLFMPLKPDSEKWAEDLFREEGIKEKDKILAIHAGASCPSRIWPQERFARVADKLAEKYNFKVLLISGPKDIAISRDVLKKMLNPAIDLAGRTSVSQVASVLRRCDLLISNDSGPVHIASALGTPVISIFGRSQKGLSPKRWGPVGLKSRILHKEVGCIKCLAHNCIKEFACLKAITVDDVIKVADGILEE